MSHARRTRERHSLRSGPLLRGLKVGLRLGGFGLVLSIVAGCLSIDPPDLFEPLPSGGHQVLFIGNSLTSANDLPGTVVELARSVGDTIRAASVSPPNFALIDHAVGLSNAIEVLRAQFWDLVLLQQGPTTTATGRDTLVLATRALEPLVVASGGRSALLMPWPPAVSPALFPVVRASYQAAAASVTAGIFVPAGDAWRLALEERPTLPLYGSDGYHPAPLGTYLAALVIYEKVTGHDARLLPGRAVVAGNSLSAAEETVRFLQQVAHTAVLLYP